MFSFKQFIKYISLYYVMFLKDQMYSFGLNYKNCKAVYLPPKQELKAPPFQGLVKKKKTLFLTQKQNFF